MADNPPWDTAGNIINDVAVETGLASSESDPFASTNPTYTRLCALLKPTGRSLWREHQWTNLQRTYTFTTVQGTATYDLPSDFGRMITQTGWSQTNRLPLGGPVSPQEWEYLAATLGGVSFTVMFRPFRRQIYIYPNTDTPGGNVIAYEYMSRYWVQPSGQTDGTADKPTASTDTILFDPQLVTRALSARALKSFGFDAQAATAEMDYRQALEQIKGDDSPGQTLRLDEGSADEGLIGERNIPITGLGS